MGAEGGLPVARLESVVLNEMPSTGTQQANLPPPS